MVAHLYRLVYVVGDEDDGLVDLLLDAQELVLEHLARDGVHRAKRLVHEHHRRVGGHRPCDPDALLLAAGKLRRVALSVLLRVEADETQQFRSTVVHSFAVPFEQARDRTDVLADGAVGK